MKRGHRTELIVVSIIIAANSAFLVYQFRFNHRFLYDQARALYCRGDKARSLQKYRRLIAHFPEAPYADAVHYDLARMFYHEKKYEEGVRRYEEFLSRFPESECANKARIELAEMRRSLDAIERYMSELRDENDRDDAARALAIMGRPAVDALVRALNDHDSSVRSAAARALTWIGPSATDALLVALKRESHTARVQAALCLFDIRQKNAIEAVPPLCAALRDKNEDSHARQRAAEAIGYFGDARGVEPLIAALEDKNEDPDVRSSVARALGSIGDVGAVGALIAVLKDENESSDVRSRAARALGKMVDTRAVGPLIAALKDKDSQVAYSAACALEQSGWRPEDIKERICYLIAKQERWELVKIGERAVGPLIATLRRQDSDYRSYAAEALGSIGDSRAAQPLIETLKDKDPSVRYAAAWALGKIEGPRAVGPLIALLKDADASVRYIAAWRLGKIGDARAAEPLIALLKDRSSDVRLKAVWALERLGRRPKDDIERIYYLIARQEWNELSHIGGPALEPLLRILNEGEPDTRRRAAEVLGNIGDYRAIESLIAVLRDEDRNLRDQAILSLTEITGEHFGQDVEGWQLWWRQTTQDVK